MLKIEVGKDYRCRNGAKAELVTEIGSGDYPFAALTSHEEHGKCLLSFTKDGTWVKGQTDEYDMIEEWSDPVAETGPVTTANCADTDLKSEIARKAVEIVNGSRRKDYGAPEDNFERIARFWQAYFLNTGRDVTVTASDVSPMMRLLKEARLCASPDHADSHVDLVGYALTGAEIAGVKL